jgi:phosphatidylglycerophosphatase C
LPTVLGTGVAVEQDIGAPVRFVATADVEDEGIGADGDFDAAVVERTESAGELSHSTGSWQTARTLAGWRTVPVEGPVVAAFDVDGTLTTRDCVVPFLRRVAGSRGLTAGLLRSARDVVPALARRDRDRLKAIASEIVFAGRPIADVEARADEFAAEVARSWLRDHVVDVLRGHQRRGDHVVLVSASYGVYLRPLGARLAVADVIGTELVVDGGACTGALDGGNCRGAAKVVRLHRFLADRFGGRDRVTLWAYGDSPGDAAMLADADHPIWVDEVTR